MPRLVSGWIRPLRRDNDLDFMEQVVHGFIVLGLDEPSTKCICCFGVAISVAVDVSYLDSADDTKGVASYLLLAVNVRPWLLINSPCSLYRYSASNESSVGALGWN